MSKILCLFIHWEFVLMNWMNVMHRLFCDFTMGYLMVGIGILRDLKNKKEGKFNIFIRSLASGRSIDNYKSL
jgi:hypothetical protein